MSSDVVRWNRTNENSTTTTKTKTTTTITTPPATTTTITITPTTTRTSTTNLNDNSDNDKIDQKLCDSFLIKKSYTSESVKNRGCGYGDSNDSSSSSRDIILVMPKLRGKSRVLLNIVSVLFVVFQLNVIFSNFIVIVAVAAAATDGDEFFHSNTAEGHYTPTWAVHIPNGNNDIADALAKEHGFINLGKIFDDHYHFHHNLVSKRSINPSHHHQKRLDQDDRVNWAKQQRAKSRKKRDFIRMRPSRTSQTMSLVNSVQLDDPKWPEMWYLNRGSDLDMNVVPAWKEGITGRGVVVTILDDGLESDHPDLEHNYDPKASYDVNSHDEDPMPRYDITDSNRHGTRCAGEVAATANNSLCAVGIAFGANVGGVRMLDGDVTDAVEARSLSLNPQHIDIYSASWGPDDDGKTVDGPGELASRAFIEGVNKGRNGKGSIFIWASGNGGREQDNCNCDGYTNSIWTLSISSATEGGHVPWYSEKCSSTLATTYSSGSQNEKQVVTTDLHHSCTSSHTGTSASAPLAAGIVALVLEANRNLTWRDLQHIVVRTAKPGNLKDPTWSNNGVGRRVSHSFGYGLMDAAEMVRTARAWKTVPEQQRCEINAPHVDKTIPSKKSISLKLTVKHCMGVNFLEHVQAKITLTSQRRGDIQIYLKSPAGTKVTLLTSRTHDVSRSGFSQWPFMSVHTWGEAPHGNWELEIHNEGRHNGHALLRDWSLIFYGTAIPIDPNDPVSVPPTPLPNSSFTLSNHHQLYSPQYPKIPSSGSKSYSVVIPNKSNYKVNSVATNSSRKQQQQQQQQVHQISSYGVILTSPKKNGKNSKNNSSKGGNKNSASTSQKSSSTNRPNSSQSSANQFTGSGGTGSKSNLYRISTPISKLLPLGRQNSGTTLRPKMSQPPNYNANYGGGTSKSDKPLRGHEKIPIKAPKQIKDNAAFGGYTATSTLTSQPQFSSGSQRYDDSNERVSSQNQRIPKMFQQYEKIQQIFPEFHPYVAPKEATSLSSSRPIANRKQFQLYEAVDMDSNMNRGAVSSSSNGRPLNVNSASGGGGGGGGGGGNGMNQKPSRENSKKMAQNFQNEREKEKERPYIPNRKSAKAQITQWDLIFYGTETPPQPDDPVRITAGRFGVYGGDLEHNFLNFDSETASGQWRNMQQVGESHVDERTASNDQTSSACMSYTPDQRCIECHPTTFIYEGHCYNSCPDNTFMVPEISSSVDEDDNQLEGEGVPYMSVRSILMKRSIINPIQQKQCSSCDSTCLRCRGHNQSDCLTCHPGYQLRIISALESYCYVLSERSSGNNLGRGDENEYNDDDGSSIRNDIYMFLIIILPAISLIVVMVVLTLFKKNIRKPCRRKNTDYSYVRVAFDMPNDEAHVLLQNEHIDSAQEPETSGEAS